MVLPLCVHIKSETQGKLGIYKKIYTCSILPGLFQNLSERLMKVNSKFSF